MTSYDVAALAGVSIGTVSNVGNRPETVAPATRRRVEDAIRELGWTRHQVAGQLRGGRSTAIGAVVVELSPHTVSLVQVIEQRLATAGFTLQISTSAFRASQELQRVDLFEQQRVRGLLLSPVEDYETHLHSLRRLDIPVVVLGREPSSGLCSVTPDEELGGRLATDHLVRLGHRRIAVVGGSSAKHAVRLRRAGAASAAGPGVTLDEVSTSSYDIPAGVAAADDLLQLAADRRPTAVVAINDQIAVGLQHGLRSAGVRIPQDVSVVGYDDSDLAATAPVPLTTVRNPYDAQGEAATRLLLEEIDAVDSATAHTHHQIRLAPALVVRRSTAAVD